ncbi:MAG: ATP-binding cassette domain-containing protein, partial [Actinomycetota bacterium]|nr:ATP-binding cassette domain-containing protein [Actinomycetota bacterium]
ETLGMVTQDGHLFHESIRDNLRFANPEANEEELWEALRQARLDGLVRSLPDGLDTVVGERGYRLSGGERQRLTIARLLLARPRVVILDEATAHLDSTSEAEVQQALSTALEGRTALVIAHRLSTIRNADLILVLEDGRIVERGTHEELLARRGRYAELYDTQFAKGDEELAHIAGLSDGGKLEEAPAVAAVPAATDLQASTNKAPAGAALATDEPGPPAPAEVA